MVGAGEVGGGVRSVAEGTFQGGDEAAAWDGLFVAVLRAVGVLAAVFMVVMGFGADGADWVSLLTCLSRMAEFAAFFALGEGGGRPHFVAVPDF